jgi:hypothetical protein
MDESPFDLARGFDGIVGLPSESDEAPASLSSVDPQLYVSVSGDAMHAPWAMGLEDDVRLLAQVFAAGGASLCREMIEGLGKGSASQSRSRDRFEEVDVELHGLELDSGGEEELRDLIRTLVGERRARGGRP